MCNNLWNSLLVLIKSLKNHTGSDQEHHIISQHNLIGLHHFVYCAKNLILRIVVTIVFGNLTFHLVKRHWLGMLRFEKVEKGSSEILHSEMKEQFWKQDPFFFNLNWKYTVCLNVDNSSIEAFAGDCVLACEMWGGGGGEGGGSYFHLLVFINLYSCLWGGSISIHGFLSRGFAPLLPGLPGGLWFI